MSTPVPATQKQLRLARSIARHNRYACRFLGAAYALLLNSESMDNAICDSPPLVKEALKEMKYLRKAVKELKAAIRQSGGGQA